MAVRTTSAAVEEIIDVVAIIDLTPFIETASALVDTCCAVDGDYDATRLELIERWLSAHCYTIREMIAESEKASVAFEKKQSKVDLGFDTSHYGQMAMRLDYKGGLAALNNRAKKGHKISYSAVWLGTANPDEVDDD